MKRFFTNPFYAVAILSLVGSPCIAVPITDDFSDLNDTANPAWTHLSGTANSTGQTWDASTGEYRLAAPNNGVTFSGNQYGFVASYIPTSYTDVNVMADLVQPSTGLAYGVAARLDGNNAFNMLKGYAYLFEQSTTGAIGTGEMVLAKINGLNVSDMGNDGPAVRLVTLDLANKDYTFNLDIVGNTLYAQLFEVGNPVPIAYQQKTDLASPYASGFSGVLGFGARSTTLPLEFITNFTMDNFKTQESLIPEPGSILLVVCGAFAILSANRRRME
jgi:hypothetical protein